MRRPLPLAALLLALAAARADAQVASGSRSVFSYTWVQVEYFQEDLDDFSDDLTGFGLSGSIELGGDFHVFAGYGSGDIDVSGVNVDTDEFSVGAGYHRAIDDRTDVFADARYIDTELAADTIGLSSGEDGYGLAVGLRFLAMDRLELSGQVDYIDIVDDDVTFSLGARFYPHPNVGLGLRYSLADAADTLGIGLRFQR